MSDFLEWLQNRFHMHFWETTHTNRWMHPTVQKCRCGLTRRFEFFENYKKMAGMPWDKGRWVYSDGTESKYSVSD